MNKSDFISLLTKSKNSICLRNDKYYVINPDTSLFGITIVIDTDKKFISAINPLMVYKTYGVRLGEGTAVQKSEVLSFVRKNIKD